MNYLNDKKLIEKTIRDNIYEIISNKYGKEINKFVYTNYEPIIRDVMIINKLDYDIYRGLFKKCDYDPYNYKGELLELGQDRCTLNLIELNHKYKKRVLIGTLGNKSYNHYDSKIRVNIKNDNNMIISYPLQMGLISKMIIYNYELNNEDKIIKIIKHNIKIKSIRDKDYKYFDLGRIYNHEPIPTIKIMFRICDFDLPFEVTRRTKFSMMIDFVSSPNIC